MKGELMKTLGSYQINNNQLSISNIIKIRNTESKN